MAEFWVDPTLAGNTGAGTQPDPYSSLARFFAQQMANFNAASEDYIVNLLAGADPDDVPDQVINTTSATARSLILRAIGANRHTGVRGTGYRYTGGTRLRITNNNSNVQVILRGIAASQMVRADGSAMGTIWDSVALFDTPSYGFIVVGTGTVTAYNCLAVGSGLVAFDVESGTLAGYNCTAIASVERGFNNAAGVLNLVNCYSGGNGADDYESANSLTNCYSEDGSQSTTVAAYSTATLINITAGSEDAKLASGSSLIGAGVGPTANGSVPTVDFEGTPRGGATTDVGFDQRTSAAGLMASATDVASATAALGTQIRLGAAAADVSSSSSALTTAVRLAANAVSRAAAAGTLNSGALLQGSASDVVTAVAALTTAVRFSAASVVSAAAAGALTSWATVTLAGDLYQGPGGVLDPNFWIDSVPTLGTTLYYDPAHIAIAPNGEISSDSNDCAALIQFYDGTSWALGLIVITPHLVAYADNVASASGQLSTAISLAAAATALATAAAAFSTGAGLAAVASDVAAASGALVTGIPLSALATDVVTAVAGLTTNIRLQASAVDASAASANLNGVITLNAAALAIASSLGHLSTQVRLGAIASNAAAAAGSLTTDIRLGGVAQVAAAATAALSTAIRMGGAANNVSTASADLTTRSPLLAAAIDAATAAAILSTGISLRANARAITFASSTLVSSIDLLASAASESRATATLTDVIETPPIGVYASDPRYVIAKTRWSACGRTQRFVCKDSAERVVLTFDLTGVLASDETLEGPITLTIVASSGTDGGAQAIFNGYPAYDMTKRKILLPVKSGIGGCDYYIKVAAATSNKHKLLALAGLLPVRS